MHFSPIVEFTATCHREMVNFPNVARDNDFLLARYDNTLIDAKPWGRGQASARHAWVQEQHSLDCALNLVEGRHPLACGHYINHPPKGTSPNVMIAPFNVHLAAGVGYVCTSAPFLTITMKGIYKTMYGARVITCMQPCAGVRKHQCAGEEHLRAFFPYVTCTATLAGILDSGVAGLALVARRQLQDEELLLDYRLNPHHPRPAWYEPVDSIAENRRWS